MQNIYSDGFTIGAEPFDLSYTSLQYKLDLLYYSNINRLGEVLTSLVYNSGIRDIADTSNIVYDPNKLYRNTSFEKTYEISDPTNTWRNADIATTDLILVKDKSYNASNSYESYDVATDFAVIKENGSHMYDGWYTIFSYALTQLADDAAVPAGTMRVNLDADPLVEYATIDNPVSSANWSPLNVISNTTIPIYNIINTAISDESKKEDFFIYTKTLSLYKHLLDSKLDNDWFDKIDALAPKMKTLEFAVETQNLPVAQTIINTLSSSLLTLLV